MMLAMATRDRVHRAIEGPTEEAARLLEELRNAPGEERLTVLIDGWFRAIAAALEELAVAVDLLARGREEPERPPSPKLEVEHPEASPDKRAEAEETDEAALAARARASREETAALREESEAGET